MALANEEFTQQHEELLNNGFMLGESRTYSTLITSEDGSSVEFIVVANQYESQQGEVQCLGYFKNPETGATIVIQGGIMSCIECAAGIVGGGLACTLVCIGTAGTIVLTPACAACVLKYVLRLVGKDMQKGGFDKERHGKIIIAISLFFILIGIVGGGLFERDFSISVIIISVAALAAGIVWRMNRNLGDMPVLFVIIGFCIMLAYIWTGVVSGNFLWIILGIILSVLWMLLVIRENPTIIKGKRGDADDE